MYKKILATFFSLFLLTISILGTSLTIPSFYIKPTASFYLSDLESISGIVIYSIQNTTAADMAVILEIHITDSTGKTILKSQSSSPFNIPANSTKNFDNTSFSRSELGVIEYDQNLYTTVAQTNRIPAGTYKYSLRVYNYANRSEYAEESDTIEITNPNPPALTFPIDNQELSSGLTSGLTFTWEAPNVRSRVEVTYTFLIGEIKDNLSADAALNSYFYKIDNLTNASFTYPTDAPAFLPGHKYAWRIQAQDETGISIGDNNGYSAIASFSFQDYSAPDLYDVNTAWPITLSWGQVFTAEKYRIEWSLTDSFSDSSYQDSESTILVLTENSLNYNYNTSYYWRVQAYNDANEKVGNISITGTCITPEFTQAPTPQNPSTVEVADTHPYFYWNSVNNAENYIIELATNSNFSNSWQFNAEGDSTNFYYDASIAPPLNYATKYYWRVRALKAGKNWGQLSESTSFTTPKQFSPESFSLNEQENSLNNSTKNSKEKVSEPIITTAEIISAGKELLKELNLNNIDFTQARLNPGILAEINPATIDIENININDFKNIDLNKIGGQYQAAWQNFSGKIKKASINLNGINLSKLISDPSSLTKLNPAHIDLASFNINELKNTLANIDPAQLSGKYSKKWQEIAEKLKNLNLGNIPKVELDLAISNIFGGPGLSKGERLIQKGPIEHKALRDQVELNLSGKQKLSRALNKALQKTGLDLKKYKIISIKINNKNNLTPELEAQLKKGTVKIEFNQ